MSTRDLLLAQVNSVCSERGYEEFEKLPTLYAGLMYLWRGELAEPCLYCYARAPIPPDSWSDELKDYQNRISITNCDRISFNDPTGSWGCLISIGVFLTSTINGTSHNGRPLFNGANNLTSYDPTSTNANSSGPGALVTRGCRGLGFDPNNLWIHLDKFGK